jgi:hypothetical protein
VPPRTVGVYTVKIPLWLDVAIEQRREPEAPKTAALLVVDDNVERKRRWLCNSFFELSIHIQYPSNNGMIAITSSGINDGEYILFGFLTARRLFKVLTHTFVPKQFICRSHEK